MFKHMLLMAVGLAVVGCKDDSPVAVGGDARVYLPLSKGNTWVYDLTTKNEWTIRFTDTTYIDGTDTVHLFQRITRSVAGIETIKVPAGEFPAAFHVVDSTMYLYRRTPATVYHGYTHRGVAHEWYAWNVGMVKQTTDDTYDDVLAYQTTSKRELHDYTVKVDD